MNRRCAQKDLEGEEHRDRKGRGSGETGLFAQAEGFVEHGKDKHAEQGCEEPVGPLPHGTAAQRRHDRAAAQRIIRAGHTRAVDARPTSQHNLAVGHKDRSKTEAPKGSH